MTDSGPGVLFALLKSPKLSFFGGQNEKDRRFKIGAREQNRASPVGTSLRRGVSNAL